MKTKRWLVTVCVVRRAYSEIEIPAETRGDAFVIAQREAKGHGMAFSGCDERVEVESVFPAAQFSQAGKARGKAGR